MGSVGTDTSVKNFKPVPLQGLGMAAANKNISGGTQSPNPAESNDPAYLFPPVPANLLPSWIGVPGTQVYGGFFLEDYSPIWNDNFTRVDTVEQMRRGDATVAQLLKGIKAPMLAAKWDITTDDDSPQGEEIREFVEKNVFGMRRTWKSFLREALTYLEFGYSVFEIIWELKDGKFYIKDLAPRIQHSILRWKLADGSRGICQIVRTDEAKNYYVEIPANKCLILTNDMEGDDLTGIPVLRAAYKHWYYKEQLYKIAGISAERYGVGIPMIKLPDGSGDADMAKAEDILSNIRASAKGHLVLPNSNWEMSIVTPAGKSSAGEDIKDQIEHHDRMILTAGLASFLNLGSTDTGSFALSSDKRGFFLTFIQDRVAYLAEEYSYQIIKRLVDLNFGEQEIYPKLSPSNVGEYDKAAMATWIKTLTDAGFMEKSVKTQDWVNNNFDLPALSDDEKELMEQDQLNSQIAEVEQAVPQEAPEEVPV